MTCSRLTGWSLPTEIDPDKTFRVVMNLEGYSCTEFPDPDRIFSGISDIDVYPDPSNRPFRGWVTTAAVDPGWTMTIDQSPAFKQFYKDLTGLDTIPDVLHWVMATGPADQPSPGMFTATDSTDTVEIPVLKPGIPLKWPLLAASVMGLGVVGIVLYKKKAF